MLGDAADAGWREKVESVPIRGCTVKLNVLLRELPNFVRVRVRTSRTTMGRSMRRSRKQEWKEGFAAARSGELPEHLWCELYFQSVHDRSVAPDGQHTMSVFAQYVPYEFARRHLGRAAERRVEQAR